MPFVSAPEKKAPRRYARIDPQALGNTGLGDDLACPHSSFPLASFPRTRMSKPFRLALPLLLVAALAASSQLRAFSDPPPSDADLAVPVAYGPSGGGTVYSVVS